MGVKVGGVVNGISTSTGWIWHSFEARVPGFQIQVFKGDVTLFDKIDVCGSKETKQCQLVAIARSIFKSLFLEKCAILV